MHIRDVPSRSLVRNISRCHFVLLDRRQSSTSADGPQNYFWLKSLRLLTLHCSHFKTQNHAFLPGINKRVVRIWLFAKWRVWRGSNPKLHTLWAMSIQMIRSKVLAWKSCSVKRNDACLWWAETTRYLMATDSVEEGAQWWLSKIYIHWPVRTKSPDTLAVSGAKLYIHWPLVTKTPYTLSDRWATMDARQLLKKVAP